jgi:hypothetical protein
MSVGSPGRVDRGARRTLLFAFPSRVVYVEDMSKPQPVDPFVSGESEVKVDAATSRILKQRIKSVGESRTVSAKAARERIHRWLSKSSTTKTR